MRLETKAYQAKILAGIHKEVIRVTIQDIAIRGYGIKAQPVYDRWQERKYTKLAILYIEPQQTYSPLSYLTHHYDKEVKQGIQFVQAELNIHEVTIYLSDHLLALRKVLENWGYKIIEVNDPKKFENVIFDDVTLAHYPETLSRLILQYESPDSIPNRLITISGQVRKPGVYDVPSDKTILEMIEAYGQGTDKPIKYIQVGGLTGPVLTPNELEQVFDFNILKDNSTMFMSSQIDVYDDSNCIVQWSMNKMLELSKKSCGKCVYCREGIFQLYRILLDATRNKNKAIDLEIIEELSDNIHIGSMCDFGKSASTPLMSALRNFVDEYEQHMNRSTCPSLTCLSYTNMYVDPEICNGCNSCQSVCPESAIAGEKDLIHVIHSNSCVKCGNCEKLCEIGAIKRYGKVTPKVPTVPIAVGTFSSGGLGRRRRR